MRKSKAVINADSYAWFAVEVYWTYNCRKRFLPALKSDADRTVYPSYEMDGFLRPISGCMMQSAAGWGSITVLLVLHGGCSGC